MTPAATPSPLTVVAVSEPPETEPPERVPPERMAPLTVPATVKLPAEVNLA